MDYEIKYQKHKSAYGVEKLPGKAGVERGGVEFSLKSKDNHIFEMPLVCH